VGGVQLLILVDWALESLDAAARTTSSKSSKERDGRRSTIITSQIAVDKWHDPAYVDVVLDRIVHNAHPINLTGHSPRRLRARTASKD